MPPDEIQHGLGAGFQPVAGYCPMGCGKTLFLADGGHITCSYLGCADPCKADELLQDMETEHIAEFDEHGFTVLHPLRERPEHLFRCTVFEDLGGLSGPPNGRPGRYRVTRHQPNASSESYRGDAIGWDFTPLTLDPERLLTPATETIAQKVVGDLRGAVVAGVCRRLLVGRGTDAWDRTCTLPPGHSGACAPGECLSCGEPGATYQVCPASKRPCGHHCNHSLTHDRCDWCERAWPGDA